MLQMNLATHPLHPLRCDSTPHDLADVSGAAGTSSRDCSSEVLRGRPCQPLRSCRLTRATITIHPLAALANRCGFPFGGTLGEPGGLGPFHRASGLAVIARGAPPRRSG